MPQTLFGHLGFGDAETPFLNPGIQDTFLDETRRLVDEYRADTDAQAAFLINRTVEVPQLLYELYVGGGMMQALGGHDQPKAVKGAAEYTIGFPLAQFGDKIADERVGVAYLTVEQYDKHVANVFKRHSARYRYEMIRRLLNNTTETFRDPLYGLVTVYPIANGDATLYPTGTASGTPTTANHFLASGYIASAISNTNNPIATIVATIAARFPDQTADGNIIVFINSAQKDQVGALASFYDVEDPNIRPSANDATLINLPTIPRSAKLIGRASGAWIAVWDTAVDPDYLVGVHRGVDAPLFRRVDTQASGLPRGLSIVAEKGYDANWPFRETIYADRFGFGAGNRLGVVVMQLTAGAYTIPVRYS